MKNFVIGLAEFVVVIALVVSFGYGAILFAEMAWNEKLIYGLPALGLGTLCLATSNIAIGGVLSLLSAD